MSACVGCGFEVDAAGVLQHQLQDGGGLGCSTDEANPGLFVDGTVLPTHGCGLTEAGGELVVAGAIGSLSEHQYRHPNGAMVGLTCTDDAAGAPVYCDTATGVLRTVPETRTTSFRLFYTDDPAPGDVTLAPGEDFVAPQFTGDVTNPSDCRTGVLSVTWVWSVEVDVEGDAANGLVDYRFTRGIDAFSRGAPMEQYWPGGTNGLHANMLRTEARNIGAGATVTLTGDVQIVNRGPATIRISDLDFYVTGIIVA